jgi:hypothetical protein
MKVSASVHDIFKPEHGKSISKQAKVIRTESYLGYKFCLQGNECDIVDPQHRIMCHDRNSIFKFKQDATEVIGYHQTSILNAQKIVRDAMRSSSEGWLGRGIYFANNIHVTSTKANNSGAIICARIKVSNVENLNAPPLYRSSDIISTGYDCKYLHHPNGEAKDEFIVRDASQIIEYVIVVFRKAVDDFRKDNNFSEI